MKFEFWTSPGHSHLKAHFESSDQYIGKREEGSGTEIRLICDTVNFDYEAKDIHPDLLGLLCLITFFPFIGNEVEFPYPVSIRLVDAFQNKCFTSKKNIRFRNVDNMLEPFVGGKQIALSFGGGIDSSAVRAMFPEAYVVHEAHTREGKLIPSRCHSIVKNIGDDAKLVTTNMRYLSSPGGWHSWPCSASTSLLMATDKAFGIILTGSILGSCFLQNGLGFWDRIEARAWHGPSGNYWQSAFESVGIPLFSPVTGVSEFQTMKQSMNLIGQGQVIYCMESDGMPCNICSKCFRRDVIRAFIDDLHQPDWEGYRTENIRLFLRKRPLYFGHIFATAFSLKPEIYPPWIINSVKSLVRVNSDWTMKVYRPAFLLCPKPWRDYIANRVLQFIEPMSEVEIAEFKSWKQV